MNAVMNAASRRALCWAEVVSWPALLVGVLLLPLSPWPLLLAVALCLGVGVLGAVTPLVNCLVLARVEWLLRGGRGRVRREGFKWHLDLGDRRVRWMPRRQSERGWRRVVLFDATKVGVRGTGTFTSVTTSLVEAQADGRFRAYVKVGLPEIKLPDREGS